MNDIPKLETLTRAPKSGGKAKQLVVLLHGLGADGQDLLSLADYFGEALPDAEFIAPNAHQKCDMGPSGYQWFSLQSIDPDFILAGVEAAAPVIHNFLDEALAERELKDKDMMISGFSQGAMMSLYTGLRRKKAPAGILGYSGAHVHGDDWEDAITARPPIMLVHGEEDPVVSVLASEAASMELSNAGLEVEFHKRPGLVHGIDPQGIEFGTAFMRRCFKQYDA